jgi:hypothetical protein
MKRLLTIGILVAACAGATAPSEPDTPRPAAFDIAAVRQSFTEECADPFVVDDLFCDQVQVSGMSADDDILNVPTTLNAAAKDRAEAICNQIAFMHFDAEAVDLGYEYVGILDQSGGNLAACTVS